MVDDLRKEEAMFKMVTLIGLGAVAALTPSALCAQQGTSSSWGSVGWGPVIPTISLTDKDRSWNHAHQAQYQAEDGSDWLRLHPQAGGFPSFR
jgi:hypothetical protein